MEKQEVAIRYYNVWFYLHLKNELDEMKIIYLTNRIETGEQLFMRDIYKWCVSQGISYKTKFVYRKDFPLKANLWNFYSYIRGRIEQNKLAHMNKI